MATSENTAGTLESLHRRRRNEGPEFGGLEDSPRRTEHNPRRSRRARPTSTIHTMAHVGDPDAGAAMQAGHNDPPPPPINANPALDAPAAPARREHHGLRLWYTWTVEYVLAITVYILYNWIVVTCLTIVLWTFLGDRLVTYESRVRAQQVYHYALVLVPILMAPVGFLLGNLYILFAGLLGSTSRSAQPEVKAGAERALTEPNELRPRLDGFEMMEYPHLNLEMPPPIQQTAGEIMTYQKTYELLQKLKNGGGWPLPNPDNLPPIPDGFENVSKAHLLYIALQPVRQATAESETYQKTCELLQGLKDEGGWPLPDLDNPPPIPRSFETVSKAHLIGIALQSVPTAAAESVTYQKTCELLQGLKNEGGWPLPNPDNPPPTPDGFENVNKAHLIHEALLAREWLLEFNRHGLNAVIEHREKAYDVMNSVLNGQKTTLSEEISRFKRAAKAADWRFVRERCDRNEMALFFFTGNVRVMARLRSVDSGTHASTTAVVISTQPPESEQPDTLEITGQGGEIDSVTRHRFHHVFPPNQTNRDVYAELDPTIEAWLHSEQDVCIIADGQTGAGKSYTTFFGRDNIYEHIVDKVWSWKQTWDQGRRKSAEIQVQCLEFYNNQIIDKVRPEETSDSIFHSLSTRETKKGPHDIRPTRFQEVVNKASQDGHRGHLVCMLRLKSRTSLKENVRQLLIVELASGENAVGDPDEAVAGSSNAKDQDITQVRSELSQIIMAVGLGEVRPVSLRNNLTEYLDGALSDGSQVVLLEHVVTPTQLAPVTDGLDFAGKIWDDIQARTRDRKYLDTRWPHRFLPAEPAAEASETAPAVETPETAPAIETPPAKPAVGTPLAEPAAENALAESAVGNHLAESATETPPPTHTVG